MRQARARVAALLVAATALSANAHAAGSTSGHQTFKGLIVTSGVSGQRVVVDTLIVGTGVLRRVGHIVEVPNQPGDPDNVSRDDLVFRDGTMHLVSVTLSVKASFNERTCTFRVKLRQQGSIVGGTGAYAAASGTSSATVLARGLAARNPDGSCSQEQAPIAEVDRITSRGTLSY